MNANNHIPAAAPLCGACARPAPAGWAAAAAGLRVMDRAIAVTAGVTLLSPAAPLPAWLSTSEATVCAIQAGALVLAAFVRLRPWGGRPFSGGRSFRSGELAPGELPSPFRPT